jgi:hypothetical protein
LQVIVFAGGKAARGDDEGEMKGTPFTTVP